MNFDLKECVIEIFRDGSPTVHIRIVHLPSGQSTSGSGILTLPLKKQLIDELKGRVEAL